MAVRTAPDNQKPMKFEQRKTLSSAIGLDPPAGAERVLLKAVTQNIRWRDDGTDPTAAIGIQLVTTHKPFEYNGNLSAIRFIEAVAGAELQATYYSGGTAAPWSPAILPGLKAWYDPQDAETLWDAATAGSQVALGAQVARWEDKGPDGQHLNLDHSVNGGPTRQSTYLDFDGTVGIQRTGADWGAETAEPLEVILAVKVTATGASQRIWGGIISNANARLLKHSTNTYRAYSTVANFTGPACGTTWAVVSTTISGATDSAIKVNTDTATTGSLDANCGIDGFSVAMSGGEAEVATMKCGDIVIVQPALSAANRTLLYNWLADRYPLGN